MHYIMKRLFNKANTPENLVSLLYANSVSAYCYVAFSSIRLLLFIIQQKGGDNMDRHLP